MPKINCLECVMKIAKSLFFALVCAFAFSLPALACDSAQGFSEVVVMDSGDVAFAGDQDHGTSAVVSVGRSSDEDFYSHDGWLGLAGKQYTFKVTAAGEIVALNEPICSKVTTCKTTDNVNLPNEVGWTTVAFVSL